MRKKDIKSNKIGKITGLGFFILSFLIAIVSFYLYSPILSSRADEDIDVSMTVIPVISLTVDTNTLYYTFPLSTEDAFQSKQVVAMVDTNSSDGYELYFSSSDNSTIMTSETSQLVISSDFNNTVTEGTMAANKWGYSLDNTNFLAIPAASNAVAIRNINHVPTSLEKNNAINIGIKAGAGIPSGLYYKTIKFTAIAHGSFAPTTTMQGFNCDSLENIGDSTPLIDIRDGSEYMVKKLADNRCWMTENLRISDITLDGTTTNIPSGETFVLPSSDEDAGVTIDQEVGGYYNYRIATAGWYKDAGAISGTAPTDICPKGWRLPTGGYGSEQDTLMYSYYDGLTLNVEDDVILGAPKLALSGQISYDGSLNGVGTYGVYWSSTAVDGSAGYLIVRSNEARVRKAATLQDRHTIRCIANSEPAQEVLNCPEIDHGTPLTTMQNFSCSDINVGDIVTLTDSRDGTDYSVTKLVDGNCWMRENLRISDRVIDSTDSNLLSGETFTVPESNINNIHSVNGHENAMYLDQSCGGFYTFYTATASWGKDSNKTNGNSTKDICPKGWRIPYGIKYTGIEIESFRGRNYYDINTIRRAEPNWYVSGMVSDRQYQKDVSYYWVASIFNSNWQAVIMSLNENYTTELIDTAARETGYPIRCIAQ